MKRYIARTVVRRIVWIVTGLAVYALLSFLGIGNAHAQQVPDYLNCYSQTTAAPWCPDEGEAFAAAQQRAQQFISGSVDTICPPVITSHSHSLYGAYFRVSLNVRRSGIDGPCTGAGGGVANVARQYLAEQTCANRPGLGEGTWYGASTGGGFPSICKDGCVFECTGFACIEQVIDGQTAWYSASWDPNGQTCSAGSGGFPSTPPSQSPPDGDGDGSSDGSDPSPNNPGQGGGGSDGKPDEDGNCGGEGQPACGEPGSGSGNGNTSGGGGNCGSPPSSTGDPILAQIAYQTWATRCAVEKQGTGTGPGNGDQPAWTKVDGMTQNPGEGSSPDDTDVIRDGGVIDGSELDFSGFSGGSCIGIPGGGGSALTQGFASVLASPPPQWCEYIDMVKALFILFATIGTVFWLTRN
ncbi:hypothetical protein [Luteimonas sp. R10]|uniref:hypothetical protein n=1 Tax=Luteimonas sp. R10 TaxID=3108176 RepID=UPI003090B787|nr:hypothetical protein U3649_11945 [Luteimonas sp. R10]